MAAPAAVSAAELSVGHYHCYLLRSKHPRHPNSTYIGFTVDPRRRIRQHNGELTNGARRTKSKRPWEMTVVVSGFPTKAAALQFEWAWQHPKRSTKLKHQLHKLKYRSGFKGCLNTVALMFTVLPFSNYPLKVIALSDAAFEVLGAVVKTLTLPAHSRLSCSKGTFQDLMVYQAPPDSDGSDVGGDGDDSDAQSGYWSSVSSVASVSSRGSRPAHPTSAAAGGDDEEVACMVCSDRRGVASDLIFTCDRCLCGFHVRCLADAFLGPVMKLRQLIPKQGTCPVCKHNIMWVGVVQAVRSATRRSAARKRPRQRARRSATTSSSTRPTTRSRGRGSTTLEASDADGSDGSVVSSAAAAGKRMTRSRRKRRRAGASQVLSPVHEAGTAVGDCARDSDASSVATQLDDVL